jgi:DNA-binding transcriptional regulator YdaS (Cro superfamily)
MDTIIDLVVERAGGAGNLARQLDVRTPTIASWRRAGQIPAERVLAVAKITGLSPHLLRADIYPDPAWVPPA